MSEIENDKIIYYTKLLILAVGAALLLVGSCGIVYDYASDFIVEAGNEGWLLIAAGVLIMSVAIAGYVLIPIVNERYRQERINRYYKNKYPDNADMDILAHDIREQLQIMQGRLELLDEITDSVKTGHGDVKNFDAVAEELQKQKGNYEKLTALITRLHAYVVKQ
jgi:Flp pilus assembly protein TadB